MQYKYSKKINVSFSHLDATLRLGLIAALELVQDVMTEYFATIKSDNLTLLRENQALWVFTKTKIRFNSNPTWLDEVNCQSYMTGVKAIRGNLENTFSSSNGEVFFVAKQEICPIDLASRKIRKISTISFPSDLEVCEPLLKSDFFKQYESFTNSEIVAKEKVTFCDTDHNGHTNNIKYVRYLLNTFTKVFFENNFVQEMEIHYLSETVEGEILDIYRKKVADGYAFLIKNETKDILRAWIRVS